MAATLCMVGFGGGGTNAGTWYAGMGLNGQGPDFQNDWGGSEGRYQTAIESPGTLSNLKTGAVVNGWSGAVTIRSRVGGANGNLVVTLTANTVADYEDTTNSDSLDDTELWNWSVNQAAGSGTEVRLRPIVAVFTPTSGTYTLMAFNSLNWSSAAGTVVPFVSAGVNSGDDTVISARVPFDSTLRKAWGYADNNDRSDTITVKSYRLGTGDGNLTISWVAAATGTREDVTNTDSVTAGQRWSWDLITQGGTGSITIRTLRIELSTAASEFLLTGITASGEHTTDVRYFPAAGDMTAVNFTEGRSAAKAPLAFTWEELSGYCPSLSGSSMTMRSRVNGANGNQVVTWTGTGQQTDATNTDSVADEDTFNLSCVTASSIGTMALASSMGTADTGVALIDDMRPRRGVHRGVARRMAA